MILRKCKNVSGFLGGIGHLKQLRHLDVSDSDIRVLPDDFLNLTNLQTLDLYKCKKFEVLPEDIGLLKYLSHLNLSHSSITKIPDSITRITSLVTLEITWSHKLEALPLELGVLTRLRCLDLSLTKIKVLPDSCISDLCNLEIVMFGSTCQLPEEIKNWPKLRVFKHWRFYDIMPRGMENLTCLETLNSYVVRKAATDFQERGHNGLEELAALNSLQVLRIIRLQNVRGGREDAERAKLMDKQNLRVLMLWWGSGEDDEDEYDDMGLDDEDEYDDDSVFEGLRPHPNLRELRIWGFSGLNLPKWVGSSSNLPNLVELTLFNCKRCEKLPALGGLPCLRDLSIEDMESVKCLGKGFYYQQHDEEETSSSTQNSTSSTSLLLFPSLVYLSIDGKINLEEWVSPSPSSSYICVDSFPLLEKLQIWRCPKLRSPPNSFPSLRELELVTTNGEAVNSILSSGGCLTSLTSITIKDSPELIFPTGGTTPRHFSKSSFSKDQWLL